ncbi:MAG: hypothetical protein AAGJ50_09605, partial [Pseudomonadota bacterium]
MTEPTPLGDIERLAAILSRLAETIDQRASAENSASYTAKLLSSGKPGEDGGESFNVSKGCWLGHGRS